MVILVLSLYSPSHAGRDFLGYSPDRHALDCEAASPLADLLWDDRASLESVRDVDIEEALTCVYLYKEIMDVRKDFSGADYRRLIGEKSVLDLEGGGTYSIALWLDVPATMFLGAILAEEDGQLILYDFGRDMAVKDMDGDGKPEMLVTYPFIYKSWEFFGGASIFWTDVFVYDGGLKKVNEIFKAFFSERLAEYREYRRTIERFDIEEYFKKEGQKYRDPEAYRKNLYAKRKDYLFALDSAIDAAEDILRANVPGQGGLEGK